MTLKLHLMRHGQIEWSLSGQHTGRTTAAILDECPDLNLFHEGCPNGESPDQISARVDKLI